MTYASTAALVVVDVQQGFADPVWGRTANLECEENVARLVTAWQDTGRPVVVVRHDSVEPGSPLRPGQPGNDLVPAVAAARADVLVTKSVNSAFYGEPDLHAWLRGRGIGQLVLCGIQTNMCVETTARMAGNLGYDVTFVLDATRTFDLEGPDGLSATAEELMRTTAVTLHGGGFATVRSTQAVLAAASSTAPA